MPYLRCRSEPYSRTCVCRSWVLVGTCRAVCAAARAFVFGGSRIVWISNDCAWPVRASHGLTFVHVPRGFRDQVTYTAALRPVAFPSRADHVDGDGNQSSPFWKTRFQRSRGELLARATARATLFLSHSFLGVFSSSFHLLGKFYFF